MNVSSVGLSSLFVAGSLIEGEYKIEYLGVEIDFSGTFACEALL